MHHCPICDKPKKKLNDIAPWGIKYKKCCDGCKAVASYFVSRYPYNEIWYNSINIDYLHSLVKYPPEIQTNCTFKILSKEDSNAFISELIVKNKTDFENLIQFYDTLDIACLLLIIFEEVSLKLKNDWDSLDQIKTGAMLEASNFRKIVIYLTQLTVSSKKAKQLINKTHTIDFKELLHIGSKQLYLHETLDMLYYFPEINETIVFENRIVTGPIETYGFKIEDLSAAQIKSTKEDSALEIREGIYDFAEALNEVMTKEIGISATEIFFCYLTLSDLAKKYSGIFFITPYEFELFLIENVFKTMTKNKDSQKMEIIKKLLFYSSEDSLPPAFYKLDNYYSPLFEIPVGQYYLIALSSSLIDNCRSSFFFDLNYGVNQWVFNNEKIRKEYSKIKQVKVTDPFEKSVKKVFDEAGWITSLNLKKGVIKGKKLLTIIPSNVGEIDLIAFSAGNNRLMVIDCKYLFDSGANAKEIRNLREKFLGPSKNYVEQIKIKTDWVKSNIVHFVELYDINKPNELTIEGAIITNNIVPISLEEYGITLLPFTSLEMYFSSLKISR